MAGKENQDKCDLSSLRDSMAAMEELLDTAFYGMVLVDKDGKIVKWNYERFLGIPEEAVLGKPVQEVIENTRLHIVVKTGKDEICDVQEINGRNVITSRIPIRRNGQVIGAAGTILFSDTSELQSLAKKIKNLEDAISHYKGELRKVFEAKFSFDDIISNNPRMRELKKIANKVAQYNSTVLLQGESGTGKELFAHAIHKESHRKYENFITINCAAIPKDLLESELFGYEEGAFTGAAKGGKIGKFELAAGGTILLDEIGSMPLDVQSKFLRVLESKEFERVGGNRPIKLSARIIASTNEDLEQAVERGSFRNDLYYRLNVIKIVIPPLRDRLEDIEAISKNIVEKLATDFLVPKKVLAPETIEVMKRHNWPGNVRELRNVLERSIYLAPGAVIRPEHLPEYVHSETAKVQVNGTLKEVVEKAEIEAIKSALTQAGGNRTLAAQILNIHRTALYKKISKYGLDL